jgi:hypothetical protein
MKGVLIGRSDGKSLDRKERWVGVMEEREGVREESWIHV